MHGFVGAQQSDFILFHLRISLFDGYLIVQEFWHAHSSLRMFHFLIVILYSQPHFTESVLSLEKPAAVQRKFVSVCFLFLGFWGTLKTWIYAMLSCRVYMSLYCIAELHKRMSMTTFGSRFKRLL